MRDDFTQQTVDLLAKRVGVRCSNPSCRKLTIGPRTDSTRIINIGVAAHITAAAPGGPRYDPILTPNCRRSPQNGIWLCQNCAKLVDNDLNRYAVEVLHKWKQRAEAAALSEVEGVPIDEGSILENSADLEVSYRKVNISQKRHDYLLEITIQNLGTEPISAYHVDLEFPARVAKEPETHVNYVMDRSDSTVCFFRAAHKDESNVIYPGDRKIIISVPYYLDTRLYMYRGRLFDELVRAKFYRQGFRPLMIEKPFGEFQIF